jgi:hypothetical protein
MKYINLVLFAGVLVMNYLANALPLNNKTTGELSDSLSNLFVPAGITFSIWGIIYLLLLIYCIIQFTAAESIGITSTTLLFGITCVLNVLWLFAWHYQKLPLSLIVMAALLVTLIVINLNIINIGPGIIKASFGVYLGWICIATIANVTALLVFYKWNGFGIPDEVWTIIMIFAGAIIATLSVINMKNPYIGLAVIWAFAGIIIRRHADYRTITIAAAIAIVIVLIFTVREFLDKSYIRQL